MNASEYQKAAARTLIDAPEQPLTDFEYMLIWNVMGLVGETAEVIDREATVHNRQAIVSAGKIAEMCKKAIFHQEGLEPEKLLQELAELLSHLLISASERPWMSAGLAKEFGDVLWYAAAICTKLGVDMAKLLPDPDCLEPIMEQNIEKVKSRFPNGWDVADAAARRDEAEA